MGLRTTWLCVRGRSKVEVLDSMGLVETGDYEGHDLAEAAVTELPGGWVIIHYEGVEKLKGPKVSERFPQGEVIWGTSSETVMWSGAYGLVDGRQVWSVEHDPDKDLNGVQASGSPPEALRSICARLQGEQALQGNEDVDYVFEAPMILTKELTGYDPTRQFDDLGFIVAVPGRTSGGGDQLAARSGLINRLASAVQDELVPAAAALGFRPAAEVPESGSVLSNRALARRRAGGIDTLDFDHGLYDGVAKISMRFIAGRKGRRGNPGQAMVPTPGRTFMQMFTGRKPEPDDAALERAVREARDLLPHLDKHLRDGTSHPDIRPASYYDHQVEEDED